MHYGADGSTSWALYDDDKPVKAIAWEEVAKQQASALIWNRRHPRQQPLDTPTPCIINASVQGSFSLSPQSKDSGADAANSYFTVFSCLQSSCQDAQHVPLPTRFEEPDAAATISPSAFSYPAPPRPPCQAAQGVQLPHEQPDDMTSSAALSAHVVPTPNEEPNATAISPSHHEAPSAHPLIPHEEPDVLAAISLLATLDAHVVPTPNEELNAMAAATSHYQAPSAHPLIPHEEPDVVAAISSLATLDAHVLPMPNEEPNAMADPWLISPSLTRPSSPLHHLHTSRLTFRAASPTQPPITGHAVAKESDTLPQSAQPAAAGTVHMLVARARLPALSASNNTASSSAQDYRSKNKLSTTSKASAAATGACGAVAATGPARTKANCSAGAVAAAGPPETKSRAGDVAANDPAKSKAKCRSGALAANGPAKSKANCRSGSTASVGPIQTKVKNTASTAAASGSVNTKAGSRAGSAATATRRKPLPAEGGSALSAIQEGELDQSRAGV